MATQAALPVSTINYTDIDDSMNANPITGDVLQQSGAKAVIQSVMNLIQLNHYEKPFHPEVGCGVNQLLFELADPTTCQLIAKEIRTTLQNFEPRVQVLNVFVNAANDNSGFDVTIEFSVISIPTPIIISVFLQRVR